MSAFHRGVQAMIRMWMWHQPIGPTPTEFEPPEVVVVDLPASGVLYLGPEYDDESEEQ